MNRKNETHLGVAKSKTNLKEASTSTISHNESSDHKNKPELIINVWIEVDIVDFLWLY